MKMKINSCSHTLQIFRLYSVQLLAVLRVPQYFGCVLDWPKYALSSQTQKFMSTTTFSHYLGQKKYRKPRFEKFYAFFHPVQALQRFWFLRTIYLTGKELSGKALAFKHLEFIF